VDVSKSIQRTSSVVIHARQHDRIAGGKVAPDRARDGESERRHIRAEHDLVGIGRAQEIRHRPMRLVDQRLGRDRGGENAAQIGVGLDHRGGHPLDGAACHLRSRGVVEEDPGGGAG
jgi:hypothetical protein